MGFAPGAGMNSITFQVKRAHWRLWDLSAGVLAHFGTTPARLDMLQVIERLGALTQTLIALKLGLSAATVSKMVTLLQKRGWVTRREDPNDLRCNLVELTDRAKLLLERVFAVVVRSGVARQAGVRSLVDRPRDPARARALLDRTREVQRALEDSASFAPAAVAVEEQDCGEGLAGADLELYERVVKYCRRRFAHLPVDYLLAA